MEAEVSISFKKMPKPFNAQIVFSIDNEKKEQIYFKRVPLNWLADDLSGETKYFKLTTGVTPKKGFSAVVFIWNIDKQEVEFTLNYLKINELKGKGVNFTIPQKFYPLIETWHLLRSALWKQLKKGSAARTLYNVKKFYIFKNLF